MKQKLNEQELRKWRRLRNLRNAAIVATPILGLVVLYIVLAYNTKHDVFDMNQNTFFLGLPIATALELGVIVAWSELEELLEKYE